MILLSHPTGNSFVRALLECLELAQTDFQFHTTVGVPASSAWPNLLPSSLKRELNRRRFPVAKQRMQTHPARELGRWLKGRFGHPVVPGSCWSIDAVARHLDSCVAASLVRAGGQVKAVYAYEDGAYATFTQARQLGVRCCYELPIAYWETSRRLLEEEATRWPEWQKTLGAPDDSTAKLQRKTEELALADVVICPSDFVQRTLPKWIRQSKRCLTAEFGSPLSVLAPAPRKLSAPLRLLFAGTLTQRKGLADLFAAMRLLCRSDVELVVMGTPILPLEFYRQQWSPWTYESPRPHAEVLALMQQCDVLVLPSIVEGRALVQQEALSCGLPLLITPNTGGEDLVTPAQTGFVVPIRQPAALAEKINWFADHRRELEEMRAAAWERSRAFTWTRYAQRVMTGCELN